MKKFLVLIIILLSTSVLAHMDHYKKYNKIEMDIFRNGELIGYNYYFFTRKGEAFALWAPSYSPEPHKPAREATGDDFHWI